MKLSDYVFRFLAEHGGKFVFMVVGGGNAHLADSLAQTIGLRYVCSQHEQAAVMAAEGYARVSGNIGVALVTQGPSATNAVTGVAGAWCDSVPMMVISGQVPCRMTTDGRAFRQLGVQQIAIVQIVESITKYAVMVTDPATIRFHLEKAHALATTGRPGPVWIDIPTDIQNAQIDPETLERFDPSLLISAPSWTDSRYQQQVEKAVTLLTTASRPIVIAGQGIRIADAVESFRDLVAKLNIPVITTWNGIDLIDHRNPLYVGCAGVMGQRGANYAVANADLVLAIGSRLDTRQVGNSPGLYARSAKKIVVDIDPSELCKGLIPIDLAIWRDARGFIFDLANALSGATLPDIEPWQKRCAQFKRAYPVVVPEYRQGSDGINSYVFVNALSGMLKDGDTVVTDMGTSFTCTMQAFTVRGRSQRLFTNSGLASMGFGLPATIGACFARPAGTVVGIYGDGGFQMNIQELQTVVQCHLPVKMFILNNNAYLTIEHTQEDFFQGRYVGVNPASGYSAPRFTDVAKAYGIPSLSVSRLDELEQAIASTLGLEGPVLCEVKMPPGQALVPLSKLDPSRNYAGAPLERMYPFLPEDEHRANMIIDPV